MIPLRDSNRSRSFPFITVLLIIINSYIYFRQFISSPLETEEFILNYAFVPTQLSIRLESLPILGYIYPPLLTSIFLHGGLFHVLFNMLYLWIFGDNIEDKLGHFRFVFFYLFAGIASNLIYFSTASNSPIPLVGASGAIAGVLGAYFITFPRAKITTLFFVFFFVFLRKIPALYFLLFWFFIQVINIVTSSGTEGSSVAWWAHIGGFVTGILIMSIYNKKAQAHY
ncbi:MAG: rhomboid family intramembrane serine protease [Clostridia bacterium]|nr:rhomboid family intramembrane serine protease [Clostridia bacterium]MDD4048231.1 rhomboid family intramembrane serine protease [Clostridia bacterium]